MFFVKFSKVTLSTVTTLISTWSLLSSGLYTGLSVVNYKFQGCSVQQWQGCHTMTIKKSESDRLFIGHIGGNWQRSPFFSVSKLGIWQPCCGMFLLIKESGATDLNSYLFCQYLFCLKLQPDEFVCLGNTSDTNFSRLIIKFSKNPKQRIKIVTATDIPLNDLNY